MNFSIFKNIKGEKYEFEYCCLTMEDAVLKKQGYEKLGLKAEIVEAKHSSCTLYDVYVKTPAKENRG